MVRVIVLRILEMIIAAGWYLPEGAVRHLQAEPATHDDAAERVETAAPGFERNLQFIGTAFRHRPQQDIVFPHMQRQLLKIKAES